MTLNHSSSSFLGLPINIPISQPRNGNLAVLSGGKWNVKAPYASFSYQNGKRHKRLDFLQLGRGCFRFPTKKMVRAVNPFTFRITCMEEPLPENMPLFRTFAPLWKEGLLFFRYSVLFAILSFAIAFFWYGQRQARTFIEARLLPSVCTMLSQQLQREVNFGKVQGISPLGITLQSCSIGSHKEEFSCGQFPTMKLRFRPFASLRRGKIVIDALLLQPNILIAQKEDFSWLGIPSPSEEDLNRHPSAEEGIDYRTKTRRSAREKASANWYKERNDLAMKAAEQGYIVPQQCDETIVTADSLDSFFSTQEYGGTSSSFSKNDGKLWKDQHSVDMGLDYVLKHAELEKSFSKNVSTKGFNFLSKIRANYRKSRLVEGHGKIFDGDIVTLKMKNLEHSAEAALAHFRGLNAGGFSAISTKGIHASGNRLDTYPSATKEHEYFNGSIEYVETSSRDYSEQFGKTENSGFSCIEESKSNKDQTHCQHHQDTREDIVENKWSDQLPSMPDISPKNKTEMNKLNPVQLSGLCSASDEGNLPNSGKLGEIDIQLVQTHDNSKLAPYDSQGAVEFGGSGSLGHENKIEDFFVGETERNGRLLGPIGFQPLRSGRELQLINLAGGLVNHIVGQIQKLKSYIKAQCMASILIQGVDSLQTHERKMLPVILDSIYFTEGTLMLLAYGDQEPREMDYVHGHVKFQKHYSCIHVQVSGNCREWRSDRTVKDGGQLSADVFVDILDQKWHANLKIRNFFAPLFERILELPITWSKGRASGEVHMCMSEGEVFPNIYGHLDVHDLAFHIFEAPSGFSDIVANLCFRGQKIFLHNARGRFGNIPVEASGDFGINPEDGEFHLMCQVSSAEVNCLMNSFKMRPLLFSLAGSVTAVFNCQGPLDAPIFVGSGIISRKTPHFDPGFLPSPANEAVTKNREAGGVAAFDHIPFSHVSANFTFNTDNCVADLYGMRATLLDGGEIRGAGTAWICPEGEMDESAMDLNLSGNFIFDRVLSRYIPNVSMMPLKIGELNGEAKLSGSLLKPRFDIKWGAPNAEDSFMDARGDIIISQDHIVVSSSSVAFDLWMKVRTSYPDYYMENADYFDYLKRVPFIVEGLDVDLRLRGFDFSSMIFSDAHDGPRNVHLKVHGKMKFLGKVVKLDTDLEDNVACLTKKNLVGEVSLSGIKLNQLIVAPQLTGSLVCSHEQIKLDTTGRPDESMFIEVFGPLWPVDKEILQSKPSFSVSFQKGQLRTNINYQPQNVANLEVRYLPLDELEIASLRGMVQRAEVQLNFQKRRGHGLLSVIHPKFSGVLGEALDVVARWSGDVITLEKSVLQQATSRYELQGEYVLPGIRDRYLFKEKQGLVIKAMDVNLGSMISSMGRWRMRLEVPGAEVSEMLPLARLLSRSTDPSVRSRSKDLFMQSLQSMGFCADSLGELLEAIQRSADWSDEVALDEISLPGLAELRGRWHGSLDASGGGHGDTLAEFDFHGEDWEWGSYRTQRVLAVGAYSNNNGLRLDNMFIQKDNATLHADGTVLGPVSNLHFAVLNFPISLLPKVVQLVDSSTTDSMNSLWQLLTPMKGILHMEGDLRGSIAKPECDVQVRLLDGAIGGVDLGRAEVVASITPTSRFLFNANFEPVNQSGHVLVQGSVPVTYIHGDTLEDEGNTKESVGAFVTSGWAKENVRGTTEENEKKGVRDRSEDGWDAQLAESLKDLNWNLLDEGEVKIDADIKDGGMMLLTAMCPYANWLSGHADINLQVRGTVEQPIFDGSAYFHRASVSSVLLQNPLTNFGGTIHVKKNRLCIISMESRVGKGKLAMKGNLPLRASESSSTDEVDVKCEVLEVHVKNIFSGQVDSHVHIAGSILQPDVSGTIKLSHGHAYLLHEKGNGDAINKLVTRKSFPSRGFRQLATPGNLSRFFGSQPASAPSKLTKSSAKDDKVEGEIENVNNKPRLDVQLTDLQFIFGPKLRIIYRLILNFAVGGELVLNGRAHPKLIRPKGVLTFRNGEINLVAAQVRLKYDHLNVAEFEPDVGLDPTLDLALVGSDWQFRIQGPASNWQENLVVTSLRTVDQDVLSASETAKGFENQLAESLLERDGQLAFKKLATLTVENLMPKIENTGEFGRARWRLVSGPQIQSFLSVDPTVDLLKFLANNIFLSAEFEARLSKRLQASAITQMKESKMAVQWTLVYLLTSRLRVLFQSSPSTRLMFEYSSTSQY